MFIRSATAQRDFQRWRQRRKPEALPPSKCCQSSRWYRHHILMYDSYVLRTPPIHPKMIDLGQKSLWHRLPIYCWRPERIRTKRALSNKYNGRGQYGPHRSPPVRQPACPLSRCDFQHFFRGLLEIFSCRSSRVLDPKVWNVQRRSRGGRRAPALGGLHKHHHGRITNDITPRNIFSPMMTRSTTTRISILLVKWDRTTSRIVFGNAHL